MFCFKPRIIELLESPKMMVCSLILSINLPKHILLYAIHRLLRLFHLFHCITRVTCWKGFFFAFVHPYSQSVLYYLEYYMTLWAINDAQELDPLHILLFTPRLMEIVSILNKKIDLNTENCQQYSTAIVQGITVGNHLYHFVNCNS